MQSRTRPTLKRGAHDAGNNRAAITAVDSLRSHEKFAALLPTVMRTAAIQKDCASALPGIFNNCAVLRFDSGQLVLAAPNAAMVARLKQQLPILQDALRASGWEVSAIRLKVQAEKSIVKAPPEPKPDLPQQAISALSALKYSLEKSPRNEALTTAIDAMLRRHK